MQEKIQKLLDDLRLGSYDSMRYKFEVVYDEFILKDLDSKVNLCLRLYYTNVPTAEYERRINKYLSIPMWKKKIFRIAFPESTEQDVTKVYYVDIDGKTCKISENLYNSFNIFIEEQGEKDKLIKSANRESAFGL